MRYIFNGYLAHGVKSQLLVFVNIFVITIMSVDQSPKAGIMLQITRQAMQLKRIDPKVILLQKVGYFSAQYFSTQLR